MFSAGKYRDEDNGPAKIIMILGAIIVNWQC